MQFMLEQFLLGALALLQQLLEPVGLFQRGLLVNLEQLFQSSVLMPEPAGLFPAALGPLCQCGRISGFRPDGHAKSLFPEKGMMAIFALRANVLKRSADSRGTWTLENRMTAKMSPV